MPSLWRIARVETFKTDHKRYFWHSGVKQTEWQMNIERILNMVISQVMRRLVNKGIGAGISAVTKGRGAEQQDTQANNNTPADLEQQQAAKLMAKRARQAAKIGRRL